MDVGVFSAGAALGPLLAGVISPTGWNNVFYMLISADILACVVRNTTSLLLLLVIVINLFCHYCLFLSRFG